MKPKINLLLACSFLVLLCQTVLAQKVEDKPAMDHLVQPLKLKLSEDGSKYIRFILCGQMWASYTENNPGTGGVDGQTNSHAANIGIGRARVLAVAEIFPRFLILAHFGINNQTFVNGGIPAGSTTDNTGALPMYLNPESGKGTISTLSEKKPQIFSMIFTQNLK